MIINKRAQGLPINAVIIIVLVILVAVFLIFGFTVGWKNILPWIKTDNVATIANQCQTACAMQAQYDFCAKPREVIIDGATVATDNCKALATESQYSDYGIDDCPGLCERAEAQRTP